MGAQKGQKYASTQYFFWNDLPYKVIREHRRKNIIEAYDITNKKRVSLPWVSWKKHKKDAYVTSKVAEILGRHEIRVRLWLTHGKIPHPFQISSVDGIERDFGVTKVNCLWSEEDIYRAQEYMESTGRKNVPSKAEIQAKLNNNRLVQFIQDEDGEFIPLWRAE